MQGVAPAELESKKANLLTDMQSQERLKEKKKEYSSLLIVFFIFFVLRKGKEKNSFLYFLIPFHCNTSTLGPSSPTAENKLRENFWNILKTREPLQSQPNKVQ